MRAAATAAAALLLAALSACNLAPPYKAPTVPVPPSYKEPSVNWTPGAPADTRIRGPWWELFGQPELNRLEVEAASANQTLAAASANYAAASAAVRQARAAFFPTASAGLTVTGSHISTFGPFTAGVTFANYSASAQASWEPDFWGRVRNNVRAAEFSAQSAAADRENVRLSLQSDLAADYFQLRAQDSLKRLLEETAAAGRESLDLTRKRLAAGLETDEAVAQAEAQWKAVLALSSSVDSLRAQYEHAIAVLAGHPPAAFSLPAAPLPDTVPSIPSVLPAQLLERRPDIASAERLVAAANARIGIARAAFFPDVVLSASGGFQNFDITRWFVLPSRLWSVGPSVTQAVFDAGLRRATVQQFRAAYDESVAGYRQTVLTAFQQVEDNLASLAALDRVIADQDGAVSAAARSLSEARVRYSSGLDPYLNVLTAQTLLLSYRQSALNYRAQRMTASVLLVKSLGGGWQSASLPAPRDTARPPAKP